jgi:hypothetical protein
MSRRIAILALASSATLIATYASADNPTVAQHTVEHHAIERPLGPTRPYVRRHRPRLSAPVYVIGEPVVTGSVTVAVPSVLYPIDMRQIYMIAPSAKIISIRGDD